MASFLTITTSSALLGIAPPCPSSTTTSLLFPNPSTFASCAAAAAPPSSPRTHKEQSFQLRDWLTSGCKAFTALAAALVLSSSPLALAADDAATAFHKYFGTASSASSYGGYGGNVSKQDTAEYVYEVPQNWKERLISKIQKGTNGTDSEFYNPRRKEEKVYLVFLPGFRRIAARESVLNDLALSDVSLQDMISSAENIQASDRKDSNGQIYYDFEIDSPVAHGLISVTCAKNKLYAHFVRAPTQDWARDESLLRHIHDSFSTVGEAPLETV